MDFLYYTKAVEILYPIAFPISVSIIDGNAFSNWLPFTAWTAIDIIFSSWFYSLLIADGLFIEVKKYPRLNLYIFKIKPVNYIAAYPNPSKD